MGVTQSHSADEADWRPEKGRTPKLLVIGLHYMYSRFISSHFRAATVVVALIAGLLACSSDGEKAADSTAEATTTEEATATTSKPTTTTDAPTTTAPASTTSPPAAATTTTTTFAETAIETVGPRPAPPATTTTIPAVPVYPLTGIENPDPLIAARPALVVKVDNAPAARPQTGFNAADIVYEEIVNDSYTRFAMVFQSRGSNPVGPIRSGRIQDIDLFTAYNRPLFAWSGGNRTVTNAIDASDLINIGPNHAAVYFRSRDRKRPSNLYSTTDALWSRTPLYAPPATQQFSYRKADAAPAGTPSPGVAMALDSIDVRWDWDASKGLYLRTMEGRAHMDAAGGQVSTNNVVVLAVNYLPGISGSPDAQTIGEGEAFVLTGGNYIHATWSRPDKYTPFTLTADDGSIVLLQQGRTFVELPRLASTIVLPST